MFMGLAMSGSAATSWASKPGGRRNAFFSSAEHRASVGATSGAGVFGAWAGTASVRANSGKRATADRTRRIIASVVSVIVTGPRQAEDDRHADGAEDQQESEQCGREVGEPGGQRNRDND